MKHLSPKDRRRIRREQNRKHRPHRAATEYAWAYRPPVRTEPAPLSPEEILRIVDAIQF